MQLGTNNLFIYGNKGHEEKAVVRQKRDPFPNKRDAWTSTMETSKNKGQFGTKRYGIKNKNSISSVFAGMQMK